MAFGDLLLHLDSYPEPTREADIDAAIAFAAAIGGTLTALGIRVTIPAESNRIADYLIGLSQARGLHQKGDPRRRLFGRIAGARGSLRRAGPCRAGGAHARHVSDPDERAVHRSA